MNEQIIYTITSLVISAALFVFAKIIIQSKLSELKGSQKIIGIISIGIVIGEIMYIGNTWHLFEIAFEAIASIGVHSAFFLSRYNHILEMLSLELAFT